MSHNETVSLSNSLSIDCEKKFGESEQLSDSVLTEHDSRFDLECRKTHLSLNLMPVSA
jgi:hypothetical protein